VFLDGPGAGKHIQAGAKKAGPSAHFAVFQGTSNGGQRCANLRP
jgi:hypothetical protein